MRTHLCVLAALLLAAPLMATAPEPPTKSAPTASDDTIDRRWLDALPKEDRAAVDLLRGYAPPALRTGLSWTTDETPDWTALRGRVVLLQTWTSGSTAGRRAMTRVSTLREQFPESDLAILAIHTPENAKRAATVLERKPVKVPVAIDANGLQCDDFGAFKRPVNVLVDRNGTVRYTGLNARGVTEAVKRLVAEPHDPDATPKVRETPKESMGTVAFPEPSGAVTKARDVRGQSAPQLYVEQWVNGAPNLHEKVVVVEFWATWCGPCVQGIPHMNELADAFRKDVAIIGISNEPVGTLQNFMRKKAMRYHIASDKSAKGSPQMKAAVNSTVWPHAIVMSSDWVVRWQGHPASLTTQQLGAIVQANRTLNTARRGGAVRRWERELGG